MPRPPEALERRDLPAAFGVLIEHPSTPASRPWDVAVASDGTAWFANRPATRSGVSTPPDAWPSSPSRPRRPSTASSPPPPGQPAGPTSPVRRRQGRPDYSGWRHHRGAGPSAGARYVDLALLSPDAARVTQDNGAVVPLFDLGRPAGLRPPSPPIRSRPPLGRQRRRLRLNRRTRALLHRAGCRRGGRLPDRQQRLRLHDDGSPAGRQPADVDRRRVRRGGLLHGVRPGPDRSVDRASLAVTEYALAAGSAVGHRRGAGWLRVVH
ncbi:MAG: hypothetical protein WKF75_00650 [Singulisphaera sp.]